MVSDATVVAVAFILGGAMVSLTGVGLIFGIPMIAFGFFLWVVAVMWGGSKKLGKAVFRRG